MLQHGFRRKISCESQLVLVINELAKSLDKGDQIAKSLNKDDQIAKSLDKGDQINVILLDSVAYRQGMQGIQ